VMVIVEDRRAIGKRHAVLVAPLLQDVGRLMKYGL